jgi:glycosyltransferase involved in cell wall biosynthesis
MNIGIFIKSNNNKLTGGGYSYENKLVELIDKYKFNDCVNIYFIIDKNSLANKFQKKCIGIDYHKIYNSYWTIKKRIIRRIFSLDIFNKIGINNFAITEYDNYYKNEINKILLNNDINTIYFITPGSEDYGVPYISTHWDLGHVSMYAFPEVTANNKFENRERYHRVNLRKSLAIITESKKSIDELIRYENINPERIWEMPMFPSNVVELKIDNRLINDVLNNYNLIKDRFFFYPAQFWAHKNHYTLIVAFSEFLKDKNNADFKLILSGSDAGGNLSYIKDVVSNLGLNNRVIFTGFVDDISIYAFYKSAAALIMPTLLGPTNMPLLEAYYIGCPVICSDLEGHREILENNALYFNPLSWQEILKKMKTILVESERYKYNEQSYEKFNNTMKLLDNILYEIQKVRRLFK